MIFVAIFLNAKEYAVIMLVTKLAEGFIFVGRHHGRTCPRSAS